MRGVVDFWFRLGQDPNRNALQFQLERLALGGGAWISAVQRRSI